MITKLGLELEALDGKFGHHLVGMLVDTGRSQSPVRDTD